MFFLPIDVSGDLFNLVLTDRQDAVPFLPLQLELGAYLFVHSKRSCSFNLSDEIGDQNSGRQTAKQMCMIGHCVVPDGEAAASFHFIANNIEELRSPRAIDQWFARKSSPGEMIEELVKHVGHDVP